MESVFIPVLMHMLISNTIDLRTYDLGSASVSDLENYEQMLVNDTIIVYKVLDDTFPFDFFNIPVDIALRIKFDRIYSMGIPTMRDLIRNPEWKKESVVVAFTAIHRTVDRKLKGNISLPSVESQNLATHYVEELFFGGRSTAIVEFSCTNPDDVELVRKRVKSIMGESGELTDKIKALDLWQNVFEAVYNREGMRGTVHTNSGLSSTGAPLMPNFLFGSWNYIEPLFDFTKKFEDVGSAMIMKLKLLHNLNESFPVVVKNSKIEKKLKKMYEMWDDMEIATKYIIDWMFKTEMDFTDELAEQFFNFTDNIGIVRKAISAALYQPSIYRKMNMTALEIAERLYKAYLLNNASSYYISYLKLREDLDEERCENEFWPGKDGILEVEIGEKNMLSYEPESLEACKEECFNSRRCRAIAYADQQLGSNQSKECWIYYRSTTTAPLIPNNNETNMRIYDRKCM